MTRTTSRPGGLAMPHPLRREKAKVASAIAFIFAGLPLVYWFYIAVVPDAWTASLPELPRVLFAVVVPPVLAALLVIPPVHSRWMRAVYRLESEGNHLRLASQPDRLLRPGGTVVLIARRPSRMARTRDSFMAHALLGERPRFDVIYRPPGGADIEACKGSTSYLDARALAEGITRLAGGTLEEHRTPPGETPGIRRASWEELDVPFGRKAAADPARYLGPEVGLPGGVEVRARGGQEQLHWRARPGPLLRVVGLWMLPLIASWFASGMVDVPFDNLWAHGPFLLVMALPLPWFAARVTRRVRVSISSMCVTVHRRSLFGSREDSVAPAAIEDILRDRHEVGLITGDRLVRIPNLQPDQSRFIGRWIGAALLRMQA